ncbi:MAG: hypothetical protein ACREJB_12775, partial [Planctomycetaceae bacterium]
NWVSNIEEEKRQEAKLITMPDAGLPGEVKENAGQLLPEPVPVGTVLKVEGTCLISDDGKKHLSRRIAVRMKQPNRNGRLGVIESRTAPPPEEISDGRYRYEGYIHAPKEPGTYTLQVWSAEELITEAKLKVQ